MENAEDHSQSRSAEETATPANQAQAGAAGEVVKINQF
jgi:hypothetical protein